MYKKEHEQKHQISSRINISLGLFYILLAGLGYWVDGINSVSINFFPILYFTSLFMLTLMFFIIIFNFYKFFCGHNYGHFNFADEIEDYFNNLKTHYLTKGIHVTQAKQAIDSDMYTYMKETLVKNITICQKSNEEKVFLIVRIQKYLIISGIILLVTIVLYQVNRIFNWNI